MSMRTGDPDIDDAIHKFDVRREEEKNDKLSAINSLESSGLVGFIAQHSGGQISNRRSVQYVVTTCALFVISLSLCMFIYKKNTTVPPPGFEGNVPDLPEYRNPPYPANFKQHL